MTDGRPRSTSPSAPPVQVSEHTTRVHFHGAEDGGQPLGASLPLEALLPACQPSAAAATLLAAVQARPVLKIWTHGRCCPVHGDPVSGLQSALFGKEAVHQYCCFACTSTPHVVQMPWATSHPCQLHTTGRRGGSRRPMAPSRWTRQWGRSGCGASWRRRATSRPSGLSCAQYFSPACTAACSGGAASRRVAERIVSPPLGQHGVVAQPTLPSQRAAHHVHCTQLPSTLPGSHLGCCCGPQCGLQTAGAAAR
jgi:hypothetical protein